MTRENSRSLLGAAVLLRVGMAAFFDGIVLHQILNWHHMICQERSCHPLSIADLQAKNKADGWFHLAAYLITAAGVWRLFRAGGVRAAGTADAGRLFRGGLLAGAGGFNVSEGIINHHILGIHHVRFGAARDIYDVAFLVISAALLATGIGLIRRANATPRDNENIDIQNGVTERGVT